MGAVKLPDLPGRLNARTPRIIIYYVLVPLLALYTLGAIVGDPKQNNGGRTAADSATGATSQTVTTATSRSDVATPSLAPTTAPPTTAPPAPTTAVSTPTPTPTPHPTTAPATTTHTTRPPTTTTTKKPTTAITVPGYVTPGAFCSQHWAYGWTKTGKRMRCTTTATDSRFRWRAA
jgi:cytoskeletal protein RodZ